ncbi:MAG: FAD-dependent oxidoreductase [Chloroflexi bacterium]|nr:FAD-dependent oxidoreductase [Chloroflexota bacterium]MCL5076428.1 FAD-dependent oxidoreductase [Chloroflexota bacterium]
MVSNFKAPSATTDVLIIGSGAAGIFAAFDAADRGATVTIVDKGCVGRSGATVTGLYAVCAALGHTDPEDNWKVHFEDTMRAGHYLNDPALVEVFTKEAPERMLELERWGVPFVKQGNKFLQVTAAGHTYRRALHADFASGKAMIDGLLRQLRRQREIRLIEHTFITKLLTHDRRVVGALGLNLTSGQMVALAAKAVVLATGGAMELYPENTAPRPLTGDGYALAYDVGAELLDMEFVQFFPVGLAYPRGLGINRTIGAMMRYRTGGILWNRLGERFMARYDPEKKDLSTRDILARAIATEISEGRGTDRGCVYLDLSISGEETLWKEYGHFLEKLMRSGVGVIRGPVEVKPMCHHFMGGIRINPQCETTVPGLFAAGEVAGGVHGANRLGGNALSEICVFGARAGTAAADLANTAKTIPLDEAEIRHEEERITAHLRRSGPNKSPTSIKRRLQEIMAQRVGVLRDESNLNMALTELRSLRAELPRTIFVDHSLMYNMELMDLLELQNMLTVAEMVTSAAKMRRESRGAHIRVDYPETEAQWEKNIFVRKGPSGKPTLETRQRPK